MHSYLDINHINVFIGGILLVLSVVMFMIPIQPDKKWHNLRIGRNTLAAAYVILGLLMVVNGIFGDGNSDPSGMITLIVAFFQALLYTKICVLFLRPNSFDNTEYRILMIAYGIFSAGLAASYLIDATVFNWLFYIGIGLYTLLLIYCSFIFIRIYNATLKRIEYVYDEDMYYSLRWVKGCFFSALAVGVMAWFMAVFCNSEELNIAGIFVYTIYYLCMVGYFMRYIINCGFIVKSDIIETAPKAQLNDNEASISSPAHDKLLEERLNKYVEQKKFRNCNKKMEEIVEELGTSRTNLNEYTNRRYGMSFRAWRNQLRIEEAKHLLAASDVPVAEIHYVVGFTDRSNFHREFKGAVGMTPMEYRNNHQK